VRGRIVLVSKVYFINGGVEVAMTIDQRRKLRAAEAKRDSLLQTKQKATAGLATARAEIKHLKQRGSR